MQHERAVVAERTVKCERADSTEGAKRQERAGWSECAEGRERADRPERTDWSERAVYEECADWVERAVVAESAARLERAEPAECTGGVERANRTESAAKRERVIAQTRFVRHNAKPPAMRSTSLAAVSEPSRPMGGVLELLAKRKKHTPWLEARGVCHDNPDIRPQPTRGAAPSCADPALDHASIAAWVPNSIRCMDGAVPARFSIGGRAAYAPSVGRGGNSNRDAGGLARSPDIRREHQVRTAHG